MKRKQPVFLKRRIKKSDVGQAVIDMGRGIKARVNTIRPADVGKTVYINLRRLL